MTKIDPNQVLADKGIRAEFIFVPFSKSRNKNNAHVSLNWKFTLFYKDRKVLDGDYNQGSAYAPINKDRSKFVNNWEFNKALKEQCETGRNMKVYSYAGGGYTEERTTVNNPDIADLVHCLLIDGDAINYSKYEDWAGEFGYDEDSRKGYECYQQCLSTGLAMRASLGNGLLSELGKLFQDY